MEYKQIQELRTTGKVQEAFEAAIEALLSDPDDRNVRNELAMCLVVKMGRTATYAQRGEFFAYLNEVVNLHIPATGTDCANQKVVNPILKFIIDCSRHNKALDVADHLFDLVKQLQFVRPSGAYSRLLSIFAGLKNVHLQPWQGFAEFFEWWDCEYLRPSDFEVHLTAGYDSYRDGRRLSLAEQAYVMQSKAMLRDYAKGYYDRQEVLAFVIDLITLAQLHKSFVYPTYYASRLLYAIDLKQEAVDALKDFIARCASTKMWAWAQLGDYLSDVNMRYAAYCKAITCHGPDNMRIGLHEKLAAIYESRGQYDRARAEYESAAALRRRLQMTPAPAIVAKQSEPWWTETTPASDNYAIQVNDSKRAERFVFGKDTIAIVVTEVSPKVQYLSYITDRMVFGRLNYASFLNEAPKVGDVYRCRITIDHTTGASKIRSLHLEQSHLARIPFIRHFRGKLTRKEGNDYGFVGRNYVRYEYLQDHADGEDVIGYARPEFNLFYKKVFWNVFILEKVGDVQFSHEMVEEQWRKFPNPQEILSQFRKRQALQVDKSAPQPAPDGAEPQAETAEMTPNDL